MFETLSGIDIRPWRNVPMFFPALLAALRFQGSSTDDLKRLDTVTWEELLLFCDRAHLTLLLSELPAGVAPAWAAARIRVNVLDNTQRMNHIRDIYRTVAEALREKQLEHLIIKGFTQYPGFVKDANLRTQNDIDIFLPPASILPARDVILNMGYEELARNVFPDHLPTLARKTNWQWRGNFYDPEMPPSIELHFCLWNEKVARLAIKECDQFWERRVTRSIEGLSFASLHPVDHVAFLSLHILRDLLLGDWIVRHVYELAYFLHKSVHDHDFWASWRQSYDGRARSLQTIAFVLAKTWFHCEVSQEVEQNICELPFAPRQWLLHFSNSPLELMFVPNRDSVWLHTSLVDSLPVQVGIVRRGLLPNRIPPLSAARLHSYRKNGVAEKASQRLSLRYMAYLTNRLHHFSHVCFRGIWRGGWWWLSQRQLGKSFGRAALPPQL